MGFGALVRARGAASTRFDLENPSDIARRSDLMLALQDLRGVVVLDEIQRRPELFPALRVLANRRPVPAQFLVLGGASAELLQQRSETLAGLISIVPHTLSSILYGRSRSPGSFMTWAQQEDSA